MAKKLSGFTRQCVISFIDLYAKTKRNFPKVREVSWEDSGCMTKSVLEKAIQCTLDVPKSQKSSRTECNCLLGNDIGMYNTCGHACVYCYANYERRAVMRNKKFHDPNSPFLLGGFQENDKIKEVKQVSWLNEQLSFQFDEGEK